MVPTEALAIAIDTANGVNARDLIECVLGFCRFLRTVATLSINAWYFSTQ
jgi:hypothetical protein